ncbi:Uncharacterized protein APZ42_025469 [Daphnia magna]|uniref:Secreted protein n=1 Tax=Daphnia magna TaxID=35525 RepID=A0A162DD79_9CRUS|nr:Uncharacterized protein APZ42_025469 [Daphnia magna]
MLGALSVTFTLDILYIGKQCVCAQCNEELLFLEQHGVCDGKLIKKRLVSWWAIQFSSLVASLRYDSSLTIAYTFDC